MIKRIINFGYSSTNFLNCYQTETSLFRAIKLGLIAKVEALLESGEHINTKVNGESPLHLAIMVCDLKLVNLLISKGADITATNYYNQTCLYLATHRSDANWELVEILLNAGADVNKPDFLGRRPLFNAIFYNNEKILKLLINHGADLNVVDDLGETFLHYAVLYAYDNLNIAKFLLEVGVGDVPNKSGVTALNIAQSLGRFKMAALIRGNRIILESNKISISNRI